MKVAIIGAGVIGVTTAYALAKRGYEVTVLDAATEMAACTSFANGGQLSYSYADPMADPSILPNMLKYGLGLDTGIKVSKPFDPRLITWTFRFLGQCTNKTMARNLTNMLKLCAESKVALRSVIEDTGVLFDHKRSGKLMVTSSERVMSRLEKRVSLKQSLGCDVRLVSAAECVSLESNLNGYTGALIGGIYAPDDECGDAHLFTVQLAETITSRYNVDFKLATKVLGFSKTRGRINTVITDKGDLAADVVVIAAGSSSASLLKQLAIKLPIYPLKGYSVTAPIAAGTPQVSITDLDRKLVVAKIGGQVRIAGFSDFSGESVEPTAHRINDLIAESKAFLPNGADYDGAGQAWAGLRPATPDGAPIIAQRGFENMFVNVGHGMLGWTLSCGSAQTVRKLIETAFPIDGRRAHKPFPKEAA